MWSDIRYAWHSLLKSPGFTAVAVLTLAIGIGASTAIFSMVDSILLRPLAYREPQQLYSIQEVIPQLAKRYPLLPVNALHFRAWQRECKSFEEIAITGPHPMQMFQSGEAEQIYGIEASANLFHTLGVYPALGRSFLSHEDQPGRDRVVILSHDFWRTRFNADRTLIGRSITLDGVPHEVVGILPESFRFPRQHQLVSIADGEGAEARTDFFKPLDAVQMLDKKGYSYAAIARLKPGVTSLQALTELNAVQSRLGKEPSFTDLRDLRAHLAPLAAQVIGPARQGLMLLLAAVGALLLIVCVNLANLLLARVLARTRDTAIRVALGATVSRVVRQALMESLLIAAFGGLLGICLAHVGVAWLVHEAPVQIPRLDEVGVDMRVLWFAVALSLTTGLAVGVLPAWRLARTQPQFSLKAGGQNSTEGRHTLGLRKMLISSEVGLSTLLLLLAGLLISSLYHLLRVDAGFSAERVLAAEVTMPTQSYPEPDNRQLFLDNAVDRIGALPGVTASGWINLLPLRGESMVNPVRLPGKEQTSADDLPMANLRVVSSGYFATMGISLLAGRPFVEADRGRNVVIVSKSLADRLWPGKNPIGQRVIAGGRQDLSEIEVIGVAVDVRTARLDKAAPLMIYAHSLGPYSTFPGLEDAIVVRTAMDPVAAAAAVRAVIHGLDPQVPITALQPMSEIVSQSVAVRRFQMLLVVVFAGCALFLAALGIFGVVAYSVEERRRELGIRIALGARHGSLKRMILRQGMWPVAVGLVAGLIVAVLSGQLIQSLLFGIEPSNLRTMAGVAAIVALVGVAACYIPARRVMKTDPLTALRAE